MTRTLLVPCLCCGGDKGFDVPYDIDRRDGSVVTRWQECDACRDENGTPTGNAEHELVPLDPWDLDEVPPVEAYDKA